MMKPRVFQLKLPRLRGFPGVLALVGGGLLLAVAVAAVVFVGLAVAVAAVVVSTGAALYYSIRRNLNAPVARPEVYARQEPSLTEVREIQVDEVLQRSNDSR